MKLTATIGFVLSLVVTVFPSTPTMAGKQAAPLFHISGAIRPPDALISPASKREAVIQFDRAAVSTITSSGTILIPLFDGHTYTATRTMVESRSLDRAMWSGKISSAGFEGDVIITFEHGYVAGLIYSPEGVYEITPRGEGHLLTEIDQAAMPECGGSIDPGSDSSLIAERAPRADVDSGDRIDVLVVYTTATKAILGGDTQARAHAQQAIDATNVAYFNSRVRQRVRLVHAEEYLYTEVSASSDLANLRNSVPVQTLRNTHNADLVAMIGEISGACGIGYLMGSAGGNPNNGYTATARSCAVGNLSFAHELGHNMGSHHNPENGSNPTYPYGFGHYVNGVFRTVMSYSDPCGSGCTRTPYFSSPAIFRGDHLTGIENARDNARSINNTAVTIANYRYSGRSLSISNFGVGSSIPRIIERDLLWTSDNVTGNVRIELSRDEGTTWETVIPNTANDGTETISIFGRSTKRARLRVVSLDDTATTDSSVSNISIR